jgi:hypothetical protein
MRPVRVITRTDKPSVRLVFFQISVRIITLTDIPSVQSIIVTKMCSVRVIILADILSVRLIILTRRVSVRIIGPTDILSVRVISWRSIIIILTDMASVRIKANQPRQHPNYSGRNALWKIHHSYRYIFCTNRDSYRYTFCAGHYSQRYIFFLRHARSTGQRPSSWGSILIALTGTHSYESCTIDLKKSRLAQAASYHSYKWKLCTIRSQAHLHQKNYQMLKKHQVLHTHTLDRHKAN